MRAPVLSVLLAAAIMAAPAAPAAGQQQPTLTADLVTDIDVAQKKFIALARAIPENKFAWRPAEGVRSVGEVFLHIAADNYLIPAALGFAPDSSTGIRGDDYKTAVAFEKRQLSKDAIIQELERSFAHVRKGVSDTPAARLAEPVTMFGQPFTMQQGWIMATTHLHEHLGQLVAYARMNGITPPWS